MDKTLALTLPQAQAVYSAMCALNNLGKSTVSVIIPRAPGQNDEPRVTWSFSGVAVRLSRTFHVEDYADQSAFAAAYGLDSGADPELLEALQAEQEWRDRERDGALDPEWDYESMVGAKRRAAIAKATA